jgi:HEAT repeat protein
MSKDEKISNGPIGLDVGTSRIVVARREEKKYQFEAQLNAFITLPWSKLTENLLRQEGVFHEVEGDEIVVAGNDAQKFAEVFHVETRRPMYRGVLNPREPHSLAVVRRIIARLLGRAGAEDKGVFFSVPAAVDNEEGGLAHHEASISQILVSLGYTPTPIEEGLAVVFSELATTNYSGFGISCGSGLCNVCLAELSLPVISFSVPKAGDYIDTHAAAVTGERATRMRIQKEQAFHLNGSDGDRVQNALTVYHDDVIRTLTNTLRTKIASAQQLPKLNKPVPVVLSGGTAMPKGFVERFIAALRMQDFPVRVSEVRISGDPLNATARGALMAALASERTFTTAATA